MKNDKTPDEKASIKQDADRCRSEIESMLLKAPAPHLIASINATQSFKYAAAEAKKAAAAPNATLGRLQEARNRLSAYYPNRSTKENP